MAGDQRATPAGNGARRTKDLVWQSEVSGFFGALLDRSKYVLDVRTFSVNGERRAKDIKDRAKSVVISCISSPLDYDDSPTPRPTADLIPVTVGAHHLTAPPRQRSLEDWAKDRLTELEFVLEKYEPDIVCFGELAYPPPLYGPDIGCDSPDGTGPISRQRHQFDNEIVDLLAKHKSNAFVFAGSFHCLRTQYAVGVLFPFGSQVDDIDGQLISEWTDANVKRRRQSAAPTTGPLKAPIIYKKRNPARSIGEFTRIPNGPEFLVFERKAGHVALMICSDILDANQFLGVSRYNLASGDHPAVDFILVPSFNTGGNFPAYCKELSAWTGAWVINVNANPEDPRFTDSTAYLCGADLHDLVAAGVVDQPSVDPCRLRPGLTSTITTFKVNHIRSDNQRSAHLGKNPFLAFRPKALDGEKDLS